MDAGPRWIVVVSLLLIHASLLSYGAAWHSPGNDEVAHLPAGISHWHFGQFKLYRVNPPLVRMLAAIPVIFAHPITDWTNVDKEGRPDWDVGQDFISANGEQSFWYFALARWACIPLSLAGGYVCFRWANELYGNMAGFLALTLWCFCPNILAYGQMITPDVGASALGVTAAYSYWRWVKDSTWLRAWVAGIALGLSELARTTWIVLFLLWPLLWFMCKWLEPRSPVGHRWFQQVGQLSLISLVGLYVINLGYGFEGSFTRLADYGFLSETLGGCHSGDATRALPGNRFRDMRIGNFPVPLPANYVLGIDMQKWEFEQKQAWYLSSYLRGQWQQGGWWYFYLYALAIKVPLGTWALVILAICLRLWGSASPIRWRDELVVLAPLFLVLTFVSSQTGFTHHMRYVLPIFPFGFVWLSHVADVLARKCCKLSALIIAAAGWSIASSLWVYPHSLSYFNELVGGPTGGHAHLVGSNIDWGQDLLYLKRWLNHHPNACPLALAYSGLVDPRIAGIKYTNPPKGPISTEDAFPRDRDSDGPRPGWYAVSVNMLHRPDRAYAYFLQLQPVAMAGYSIYIYHISTEDANRVRKELGLGPLGAAGP